MTKDDRIAQLELLLQRAAHDLEGALAELRDLRGVELADDAVIRLIRMIGEAVPVSGVIWPLR